MLYQPMQYDRWANVFIQTFYNGVKKGRYSCDSAGGNEHILPRQTMCWTPKLNGADTGWTYLVEGYAYEEMRPEVWEPYAYGVTHKPAHR